jgi:activating signal cointegrator 1
VRALTLTQPWATLVILGIKRIETRGWYPAAKDRGGRIAIHAAKGWHKADREFAAELHDQGTLPVAPTDLPLGMVLGTVRFDGLARTTTAVTWTDFTALELYLGDYSAGRYAWVFGDPQPLPEPVPARGMLGLWQWDEAS